MPRGRFDALIVSSALAVCCGAVSCSSSDRGGVGAEHEPPAARAFGSPREPLVIGDTFLIDSSVLGETRRVNVFMPTVYGEQVDRPMPVLYMPDGGLDEDFLHVAGLVQVLVSNGGMRPHLLVGIPNTQRRRDLTPPTTSQKDRTIAPVVGESAAYRRFIRDELMPAVRARYRTSGEAAIVGESLAGLFVVETLLAEPDLFQTYIAIDPSLWWNNEALLKSAESARTPARTAESANRMVFLASSDDPETAALVSRCSAALQRMPDEYVVHYAPFVSETHATIFHPAAIAAFRDLLSPRPHSP